ncbi:MAG TPA: hypothetical protein VGJ20_35295 [Xanthobacteraceae bacterium]
MVEVRSEARATAHVDRRANADCNKPITGQRSTMKFCSVRCRFAANREPKVAESFGPAGSDASRIYFASSRLK